VRPPGAQRGRAGSRLAGPRIQERHLSEPRTIRLVLSPQAEKYARRDAPVEARRMAATGALPLEPVELATVLFVLTHDPEVEVKTRARASLEKLPDAIANTVLSSADAHPALLAWLGQAWRDEAERMQTLALNAATDDDTYLFLASLPHRRVVDVVANNQTRLLRHPEIVEALGANPMTGRATIDRILSFLGLDRPEAETPEEPEATPPPEADVTDESALEALRELLGDDVSIFAPELVEEMAEDDALDAEKQGNLFALVQKMNVMQKIKLARMGNKEARGLLIRDRNKIVAAAAIRSPKITGQEVETFAKARNVSDEVLRIIANNRDWTKSYNVKLALSTNPKCPLPTAMRFVSHLQEKDLRGIMKSKDVPTPISTQARRLLQKKGRI
jgi:hypothetical protein